MADYRNTKTGEVRAFAGTPGYPWLPYEAPEEEPGSVAFRISDHDGLDLLRLDYDGSLHVRDSVTLADDLEES
jgi:hypothetical protein